MTPMARKSAGLCAPLIASLARSSSWSMFYFRNFQRVSPFPKSGISPRSALLPSQSTCIQDPYTCSKLGGFLEPEFAPQI
jgi:hypothetical protein